MSFEQLKDSLANESSLSYPKESHHVFLFKETSDYHWSAILAQCAEHVMDKPLEQRAFEPLVFLIGSIENSAENWYVPEKEGFDIVESMAKLDYITTGRLVHIFTDHVNLLSMYEPNGISDSIPRYAVNKLMHWEISMSAFNYIVGHIPGELNHWADMLSRWANSDYANIDATRMNVQPIMLVPISQSLSDEL